MVYFLIYNVYIYIYAHVIPAYIYIHCANDMYMSIKRIYIHIAVDTWYTKIAIQREKTLPFPIDKHDAYPHQVALALCTCCRICMIVYIYTYAYACAGILLSHYSRKQLTLCRGGSHPSW